MLWAAGVSAMADEPDNLVLVYLRRFDSVLGEMRADIRNLALRVGALEQRFAALEARFASLEEQMIHANQRLDRIERRLDLVDTPA
jgi:chromosome segregation ATPase